MIDLPRPSFMEKTPLELGIGTWNNVLTITQNTPLIDVMDIFLSKRVSALPVLDENEKVRCISENSTWLKSLKQYLLILRLFFSFIGIVIMVGLYSYVEDIFGASHHETGKNSWRIIQRTKKFD